MWWGDGFFRDCLRKGSILSRKKLNQAGMDKDGYSNFYMPAWLPSGPHPLKRTPFCRPTSPCAVRAGQAVAYSRLSRALHSPAILRPFFPVITRFIRVIQNQIDTASRAPGSADASIPAVQNIRRRQKKVRPTRSILSPPPDHSPWRRPVTALATCRPAHDRPGRTSITHFFFNRPGGQGPRQAAAHGVGLTPNPGPGNPQLSAVKKKDR